MRGLDTARLRTDRLVSLFERLNLAETRPMARITVDELNPRPDSVWRSAELTENQRVWAPDPSVLDERYRLLPRVLRMPTVVHAIWLGSPVSTQRSATTVVHRLLGAFADQVRNTMTVVLWTDVPRRDFLFGSGEVAEMRAWAVQHNILLVNVDEVFHAGAPMVRAAEYRLESAKATPTGLTAASNILRLEALDRFGGIYIDGDNPVVSLDGIQDLLDPPGFAIHRTVRPEGVGTSNTALLAARGHPFAGLFLEQIGENYRYTQPDLSSYGRDLPNTRQAHADAYLREPEGWLRRRSVMERTGSYNLFDLAARTGYVLPAHFPAITEDQVVHGAGLSWAGDSTAAAPPFRDDEVVRMLQHAISYLVWDLINRHGDLNLVAITPIIERLPDQALGWEVVIRFIHHLPELRMLVRGVTYRGLVNTNRRFGPEAQIEDRVLDLPPSVHALLGIPAPGSPAPVRGEWIRAAFSADVPAPLWSWLTIDFAEGSAELPERHHLRELIDQFVAYLNDNRLVRVHVEGGGNGSLSWRGRTHQGAQERGRQRAEAVVGRLRSLLAQRNAEARAYDQREVDLTELITLSRGANPSSSPIQLTMTSRADRRQVLIWWTVETPPVSGPPPHQAGESSTTAGPSTRRPAQRIRGGAASETDPASTVSDYDPHEETGSVPAGVGGPSGGQLAGSRPASVTAWNQLDDMVDESLPGGMVITRANDVSGQYQYGDWMAADSRYTIVVVEPMESRFAETHLNRALEDLNSRPAGGLPIVVVVFGAVLSAGEVGALAPPHGPEVDPDSAMQRRIDTMVRVRHLVDEMLRHPRVDAVLAIEEGRDRVVVSALRAGQAHPTPGAVSAMARLADSGVSNPVVVVDVPVGRPVLADAVAQALSNVDQPMEPGTIQPVALVWENAEAAGTDDAVRLARRLADRWRVVVQVHGSTEPVPTFWPDRTALSRDHLWPPPWTAFLDPDRLAAPPGFTIAAIPSGLLLRRDSAPEPANVRLLRPTRHAAIVVAAASPDPDPAQVASAARQVLAELFRGYPLTLTLMVAGDADQGAVATTVLDGLAGGTSIRVVRSGWTVDHNGSISGETAEVIWNERPQPLWRLADNGIWFTPLTARQLTSTEVLSGAPPADAQVPFPEAEERHEIEQFAVPAGTVAVAVLSPLPVELTRARRQVDGWLDQLTAEPVVDRPLVLVPIGMGGQESWNLARFVQSRIDDRLQRSLPAPPGLVAMLLGWDGWWWPSPLAGRTATIGYGLRAEQQRFDDLHLAVDFVLRHSQAPLDVARAVSDRLAGVPNEWALSPATLARRTAESRLPVGPLHGVAPTDGEHTAQIAADPGAADQVDVVAVLVPAGLGPADPAGQLLAVRESLRLGVVQSRPADGHVRVEVQVAYSRNQVHGGRDISPWHRFQLMLTAALTNGMFQPATATRPSQWALPLPPTSDVDRPPAPQMDLWVNGYRSLYTVDLIDRRFRDGLEESIPPHAAHRILVEFGILNPAGTALWSRPDATSGRWLNAGQYAAELPVPGSTIVVLLGVRRWDSRFVQALREHAPVVSPTGNHVYSPGDRSLDWHSPGDWYVNGNLRYTTLARVLRATAGPPHDHWVGTPSRALRRLAEVSAGHAPPAAGLVAAVRRWYDEQPMPTTTHPEPVWLPVAALPEYPDSYIEHWLPEHELVALSSLAPTGPGIRVHVPVGYQRVYRPTTGDAPPIVVVDTSTLARSRPTVTAAAEDAVVITLQRVRPRGWLPLRYPLPGQEEPSVPRPEDIAAAHGWLTVDQHAALDRLALVAAPTPRDLNDLPASVIRAAQDVPEPSPEIATLAQMTPADLRQHLAEVLDQNPEVIHRGTRFREFHAALQTPRGWHPLFLVLAERLGDLLNIRIVIIDRHGALTPPERTALYLVRTADGHYRPALRHSRPDGATGEEQASGIVLSVDQRAALERLDRSASPTPFNGDALLASIIRAAQDVPAPSPEITTLARMTPADLRQHLAEVLDQNPDVVPALRLRHAGEAPPDVRYRAFLAALQRPQGWHPLFSALADGLGDLLNVRVDILHPDGTQTSFGPLTGPTLYLARTADGHYLPALRRSRPGASAAGPPSGDADRRRRAPRAAKEPDSGTVPPLSTIAAMPTIQVSPEQRRALDALGRFVARASLDAGDLPVSIIRAAQDVAEPGPEIAALAQMPPHGMRRHLASLLDQNPEVATTLRSRANELGLGVYWRDFRVALQTPQGWHPLFDTLAQFLGDLLNVGVVLIEEEGTQILLGPSSGPALYLVRIGMGRYTAALRGWRPDESATGPSRPSGDAGPGRGTRRTAEQPDPANVASVSTGESEPVTEPTDGGVDPQAPPVNRAVVEFAEGDWTRPSGTEVLRDFVDRLTGPDDPLRGGTAAIRIEGGGNGRRLDRARALRSGLHRARAAFHELRALLRARAGQGWLPPTGLTYLITTRGSGPPIINQAPASEPDGTADQRQRQVHVVATTIPGRGRVGGRPTTQAGPDHQADASNLQTPTWLPFDHLDRGLSEQARRVVTEVARAVVARARHTPPDDELVVWIEGGGNRNVRHPGEAWQSGQERAAEVWLELKPEIDGALPELAPLITYVVTSRGPDPYLL